MGNQGLGAAPDDALAGRLASLEEAIRPVRQRLGALEAEAEAVRGELRRRRRQLDVEERRAVRGQLGSGEMPSLQDLVQADVPPDETRFDDLVFVRQSATQVRLGYAAASTQEVSFTDGTRNLDAAQLGAARELWRRGWEFGTSAARGVRVYPVGSRAEKVVAADEVHLKPS